MGLIRTPHAAVIVWNFDDRLSTTGITSDTDKITEMIISTVSLTSIITNKSKGDPVGTFQFILAPTRNWISVLTPGSWCAILMSNEALDEKSFQRAKPTQVKMLGRIDTVRLDVSVGDDAARSTKYTVSGKDWGQIFNNIIYVDPLVQDPSEQGKSMANALYQQFSQNVFSDNDDPLYSTVPTNLHSILSIIGNPLKLPETDRLAKATHEVTLPSEVTNYFKFGDASADGGSTKSTGATKFTELLSLIWGPLKYEDTYDNTQPEQSGTGCMDPGVMTGQHTLWSVLQDNSNHALNEMFPEWFWPFENAGPNFLLYNRIKPFSYTKDPASLDKIDTSMRSMFQLLAFHQINDEAVINVSAGTNWADKFNFLEIKPDINELNVLGQVFKAVSQAYQGSNSKSAVFNREGFRPIIFSIHQLPFNKGKGATHPINKNLLSQWTHLAKEWYFDCHRLLNGTLIMHGSSEYIPVGDNIMFDAGLLNLSYNFNTATQSANSVYLLAHVETVQNTFTVSQDGARSFQTTIQFVRGIFVDESKQLVGGGTIDTLASSLSKDDSRNGRIILAKASNSPQEE